MKKIIIMFLLIISHVIFDAAANSVIHEIRCKGLQRVTLDTVLFNLPVKTGMSVSKDNIADCIRILFATRYFEEIVISNKDGFIIIKVKEYPIINTIKIYKNKTIKSEVIQQILDTKNIKSGNPLNYYAIYEVKKLLKDVMNNFGKMNNIVQINTIPLSRNLVNLQIEFFEGKFTKVNTINIFGNRLFSQKKLLKQLTLYNRSPWNNIVFRKIYKNQKFFDDLKKLRTFYLDRGYAKFCINDIQINLTPDKENVDLFIYIHEGHQYFFKSLVIQGDILNYIPEIKKYFNIKSGDLYNNSKIKEIELNIRNMLSKFGYIHPDIYIEYSFDDNNKFVELYIHVDVGNSLYVREIRFEGNDITKDFVIRREIEQIEQKSLNYNSVLKDQKQLQYFSYFNTVDSYIENVPNSSNQIDLIYKIEERNNTGNLNLSIGFGTESGLNMRIGINQENCLGTGNIVSLTATKNQYQTYIDASLSKRYLGIRKINIFNKIFYNKFIHNKIDMSNYNIKNYGFNINCSYPFAIYQSYDIGLNYISNQLSQIEPQIAIWRYLYSIGIDPLTIIDNKDLNSNINLHTNDILLVLAWTLNNTNRMIFPEYGSYINFTNSVTLPGSCNYYYKIVIDGKHYTPLDKYFKWVLINTIYTGYADGLHKNKESPFYENFYLGGIQTIRGFQLNSIGPKAVYYNCSDSDTNYSTCAIKKSSSAIGGNVIMLLKSELMIPFLSYINAIEYYNTARIFLFIDAGTVWDTHWKNTEMTRAAGIMDYSTFKHIRISNGVSLKWMSPIGPIIFSYSKLIKKYTGDIEEPFQFSIGKSW